MTDKSGDKDGAPATPQTDAIVRAHVEDGPFRTDHHIALAEHARSMERYWNSVRAALPVMNAPGEDSWATFELRYGGYVYVKRSHARRGITRALEAARSSYTPALAEYVAELERRATSQKEWEQNPKCEDNGVGDTMQVIANELREKFAVPECATTTNAAEQARAEDTLAGGRPAPAAPSEGQTPRTDALHADCEQNDESIYGDFGKMTMLAGQLERELAAFQRGACCPDEQACKWKPVSANAATWPKHAEVRLVFIEGAIIVDTGHSTGMGNEGWKVTDECAKPILEAMKAARSSTTPRRDGHKALRVRDGKMETFDPHPDVKTAAVDWERSCQALPVLPPNAYEGFLAGAAWARSARREHSA